MVTPKKQKSKKLSTYLGFPVSEEDVAREGNGFSKKAKQKGVALIISIMVISMMFIFMSDIIVNSAVSTRLALATRDNIKAEYLNKSGKNLALLLLTGDLMFDVMMFQQTQQKPSDGPGDFWGLFNGIPMGGGSAELLAASMESFNLNRVNDSKVIDTLKDFDGQFVLEITDEQNKININNCSFRKGECLNLIKGLMSCPAEKEFLSKKKVTAEELAANVRDWIDDGSSVTEGSSFSSESDGYSDREPSVSPKNAPFDSLEELKTVAGWDDDIYKVFSPYFTVFPVRKSKEEIHRINVNSASLDMMRCLVPTLTDDCLKNATLAMKPTADQDPLEDVAGFRNVGSRLSQLFCSKDKKLEKNFIYRSDVFRVKVTGEVGDQIRELDMVIQRGLPSQDEMKEGFSGGYKILHWKML